MLNKEHSRQRTANERSRWGKALIHLSNKNRNLSLARGGAVWSVEKGYRAWSDLLCQGSGFYSRSDEKSLKPWAEKLHTTVFCLSTDYSDCGVRKLQQRSESGVERGVRRSRTAFSPQWETALPSPGAKSSALCNCSLNSFHYFYTYSKHDRRASCIQHGCLPLVMWSEISLMYWLQ